MKIEKGKEVFRDVKGPVYNGLKEKAFCCKDHVDTYEGEIEEHINNSKCGGCCG